MNTRVAVVLVNYNGWADTIECLESLLKLDYLNYSIIVVDNKSTNNSVQNIINWANGKNDVEFTYQTTNKSLKELVYPLTTKPISLEVINDYELNTHSGNLGKITLLLSSKNSGFAGGNNLGIRLGLKNQANYIWLLNNDTVVPKNTVTELVNQFALYKKESRRVGIVGAKLKYYQEPDKIQAIIGKYNPIYGVGKHIGQDEVDTGQYTKIEISNLHYIVGASMFVSDEFIQKVGLMAEDYFLYYEEIDWINRALEKQFTIDVCFSATVYHKEGASVGNLRNNNNKSLVSDLYSIRNRILVTKRHYQKYLIPVYGSLLLIILNRIKRKQFERLIPILKIFIKSLNQA